MKFSLILIGLLLCTAAFADDTALLGNGLSSFSVLANGYVTYGAGAVVDGDIGSNAAITAGANATSYNNYAGAAITYGADAVSLSSNALGAITVGAGADAGKQGTDITPMNNAFDQISKAQSALRNMTTDTNLAATMSGNVTLAPGVYGASALTTAAGTIITLDAGGKVNPYWVFNLDTYLVTGANTIVQFAPGTTNATVAWTTGGYTTLGANTSMLGVVISTEYISEGAGANITCGNAFSNSYISIAAGNKTSATNCLDNKNGLGNGLSILNSVAISSVPEAKSSSMLLIGLGLIYLVMMRRRSEIIIDDEANVHYN